MKKKMIGAILLGLTLAAACEAPALADSRTVVTLGANLSMDQQNTMMQYFGVSSDEVDIIYVNNTQEREELSSWVPLEEIGTRTVSCAKVSPTTSGGIQVKTANLTWVTCNMIASALSTSGITNCQAVCAAPFEVSGTGALTGVMLAYETASNEQLAPERKRLANEELVRTGRLAERWGPSRATALMNETKIQVIENNITDIDEITNIINNVAITYNVTMEDDETQEIAELMQKIAEQDYDITQLKATLARVQANVAGDAGASEEEQEELESEALASEQAAMEAVQSENPDGEEPEETMSILDNTDISALADEGGQPTEEDTTQPVEEEPEDYQDPSDEIDDEPEEEPWDEPETDEEPWDEPEEESWDEPETDEEPWDESETDEEPWDEPEEESWDEPETEEEFWDETEPDTMVIEEPVTEPEDNFEPETETEEIFDIVTSESLVVLPDGETEIPDPDEESETAPEIAEDEEDFEIPESGEEPETAEDEEDFENQESGEEQEIAVDEENGEVQEVAESESLPEITADGEDSETPETTDETVSEMPVEEETVEETETLTPDSLDEEDRSIYDTAVEGLEQLFTDGTLSSLTEEVAEQVPDAVESYMLKVLVEGADAVAEEEETDSSIPQDIIEETLSLVGDSDYTDPDLNQIDQYVRRLVLEDSEGILEENPLTDEVKEEVYDSVMDTLEDAFEEGDTAETLEDTAESVAEELPLDDLADTAESVAEELPLEDAQEWAEDAEEVASEAAEEVEGWLDDNAGDVLDNLTGLF